MDQPIIPCMTIPLFLLLFVIYSSQLISTQLLEVKPVANLSTSWVNNPSHSIVVNSTQTIQMSGFSLTPILFSNTNGSRFACGFYCPSIGASKCLFGILIFPNDEKFDTLSEPQLVWSPNRDRPVKINATLDLTRRGDLVLKDADGALVWYTNTRNKYVSGLELTASGNLVLYNKTNGIIWQSFDCPTDTLLPGQILISGQKLTSNLSQGFFSLSVQDKLLSAYLESDPAQKYFETDYLEVTDYVKFEGKGFKIYRKTLTAASRFMRLEPDGHLKIYEWGGYDSKYWNVVSDILTKSIGECGYPLVCGKYGMCSKGQCSCLEDARNNVTNFTSIFRQISDRQPDLGCSMATPISCNHSQFHTLLELKNATYFNLNQDFNVEASVLDEQTRLRNCKESCLRNCSCKAAMFVYGFPNSSRSGCLLLSEVFSLRNNEEGSDRVSIFLKIEKSQNTSTTLQLNTLGEKEPGHRRAILGSIIGASVAALFLVALSFLLFRRKRKKIEDVDEFCVDQVPGMMPTRFSYNKLKSITNNFSIMLGEGGYGTVFEGVFDGTKVAVKRLDDIRHIKKSFLAEVETIGCVHHVNLVRLIGFCAENSHCLLVYEYMCNSSLDKWIFRKNEELNLGWEPRRSIILDIAKGLAYLHEECRKKILHLDIKPQNILLDENFNAKVSDFGLAKLIEKDQSRVVTTLRGTPGYLAPEWLSSIITEKVDVYSFGIVVLEILCGRRNVDHLRAEDEMHLLALFKTKAEEGRLEDIVDKHNDDMKVHGKEVAEMMMIAKWCLQSDYSKRPQMSSVVKALEGSINAENLEPCFTSALEFSSKAPGYLDGVNEGETLLFSSILSGPR